MEEPIFYTNWLNDRYPYDSEARNKLLEAKMRTYLAPKKSIKIVDVGAGTGSNALYLIDKIDGDQHWHFIEQNEGFQHFLINRLKEYASFHKYEAVTKNGVVQITTPNKHLSFQFVQGSLLDIERLLPLADVDMMVANAVFDLFSEVQLHHFLSPVITHSIACYFTLNYQGMEYQPADPFDAAFIDLYEAHMERPQPMGRAMGKQVGFFLEKALQNTYNVQKDISNWQIQSEDIKMHYYLLNFMENAIPELEMSSELSAFFPKWIQRKKDLIITRQLNLKVQHWDVFAIPNLDFSH